MSVNQSMLSFFTDASPIVKFVLLILLSCSIFSWAFIIQRYQFFKKLDAAMAIFEKRFWSGIELTQLFQDFNRQREALVGLEPVFCAGFQVFQQLDHNKPETFPLILENIQRAMYISAAREIEKYRSYLGFLATVGSISPYIGLFGTVWGIMTSIQALGNVQQATISMIAPGISEALIATALGLFAAIPAVIAYNYFSRRLNTLTTTFEIFQEEVMAIVFYQLNQPLLNPSASEDIVEEAGSEETAYA